MRTFVVLFVFFLLCPKWIFSEDLSLNLKVIPTEVVAGLPFVLELKLESESTFTLHSHLGTCNEHTRVIAKDSSGNILDNPVIDCSGFTVTPGPFDSDAKISYDRVAFTREEFFLPVGTYVISAQYESRGPYLDRYSDTDVRPVEGIWMGKLTSNEIRVKVNEPEGIDQQAWISLGPTPGSNMSSYKEFLRQNGMRLWKEYPQSSYTGWLLWKSGESAYKETKNHTAILDFEFNKKLKEQSSIRHYKEIFARIFKYWGELYLNFPDFVYRPQMLLGLSQTYFRLGHPEAAIPLIKELVEKYPQTDSAKEALSYRDVLITNNLWR